MTNAEIVRLLRKIAAVYVLQNESRFKIIAYDKAIESIGKSAVEAEDLWKEGNLSDIPGIGKSLSGHLNELFSTGKVGYYENILKNYPPAMFTLLEVPGFGPKKAYKLVTELKLTNPQKAVDDLLKAAESGKIAQMEGFGEKSEQTIISELRRFRKGGVKDNRIPLPMAQEIAESLIRYMRQSPYVLKIETLGSLRRQLSTIGDIDIAVSTNHPKDVMDWFTAFPIQEKIIESGPTGASLILSGGKHADLRVSAPNCFGSMLQYFTGSKQHNIHLREYALKQGLSLSEYGMKLIKRIKSRFSGIPQRAGNHELRMKSLNKKKNIYEFETEEGFYHALGLPWIAPELREDSGEIEAAIKEAQGIYPGLPELIDVKDIKGDFHIHTSYDVEPSHDLGSSDLADLLKKAAELHYEYLGVSDHNPSVSKHSEIQIIDIMKARKEYYEHIITSNKSVRVQLFVMMEIDILNNGNLALPEKAFDYLDAAIVSVHSSFQLGKKDMTDRILRGLSHPKARILGHPTGRLIGKRPGYELDWDRLFAYCRENDKAIEINSNPDRLDLPDILVHEAVKNRLKLVIDTDSHDISHMQLMKYGVGVARRGWGKVGDIINSMEYNKVKEWLIK